MLILILIYSASVTSAPVVFRLFPTATEGLPLCTMADEADTPASNNTDAPEDESDRAPVKKSTGRYMELLRRNKNFRIFFSGFLISSLGDSFNYVALLSIIHSHWGAGFAISLLLLCRLIPPTILAPVAGNFADKYDRRKICLISDALRCFVIPLIIVADKAGALWGVYVLSIAQFSISAFFEPASAALIPQIVDESDLVTAQGLKGILWGLATGFGSMLGGWTTAFFGSSACLGIDTITFVLSARCIYLLLEVDLKENENLGSKQGKEETTEKNEELDVPKHDKGFMAFFSYAIKFDRSIFVYCSVKAFFSTVWGGLDLLNIRFFETEFLQLDREIVGPEGDGSFLTGLSFAIMGFSIGLGLPYAQTKFDDTNPLQLRLSILFSFALVTVGGAFGAWAPHIAILYFGGSMLRPAGEGFAWSMSSALIQLETPLFLCGRAFAFDNALKSLGEAAGSMSAGTLIDRGYSLRHISTGFTLIGCVGFVYWATYCFYYKKMLQKHGPSYAVVEFEKVTNELEMIESEKPHVISAGDSREIGAVLDEEDEVLRVRH